MAFGDPWGSPFYSGGGTSTLVPGRFHVAIAGRTYRLDTSEGPGWVQGDIPVQRAQADTEADPGEGTLNTEGLWRRTRQSWHHGAGQEYADRPESDPYRFHTSTGLDVWTRNKLFLLPDTTLSLASANTNLYLVRAADRWYVTDGQVVRYTTDWVTWTAITGNPATNALSIATDGSTVYVAYGASGVRTIAAGASAMAAYATGTAAAVGYAKGRLIVLETSGANPRIYNVTASGAITDGNLLLTVPGLTVEPGQWTAEAPGALYIAGTVSDKARIWRTAVKADGTALDVPIAAGELPDGQTVRSIQGYLGSVVAVGTDDHVWLMEPDNSGNLTLRGSIPVDLPCYAFEPQDRFMWFGLTTSTLGRMDLSTNVAGNSSDFAPAYASDLVAALSGQVRSITCRGERTVVQTDAPTEHVPMMSFSVQGRGVYTETTAKVASGTISLGTISFGIGDLKNVLFADIRHTPLGSGSVTVEVAKDGGAYEEVGKSLASVVEPVSATISLGQLLAESIRLRLTIASTFDAVTMVTVRAIPAPAVGETLRLRLQLFRNQKDLGDQPFVTDVPVEVDYLRALRSARTVVPVQLGTMNFTGAVDRLARFTPHSEAQDESGGWVGWWNGTLDLDITRIEE